MNAIRQWPSLDVDLELDRICTLPALQQALQPPTVPVEEERRDNASTRNGELVNGVRWIRNGNVL